MLNQGKRALRAVLQRTIPGYLFYLKRDNAIQGKLRRPNAPWHNAVLKTQYEVEIALEEARSVKLFQHPDRSKTWDSLAALDCILSKTTQAARILDAGAEMYSVLLPWLSLYGYRNLFGVNLVFKQIIRKGPIVYEFGDITNLKYPNEYFDVVTCLSVLEHGVNLEKYFAEMTRVLKKGGLLITSTDYWETKIDTQDKEYYDTPVHVFCKEEIELALAQAKKFGLETTGTLDLSCKDKVIHWKDVDLYFTFLIFTLRKPL